MDQPRVPPTVTTSPTVITVAHGMRLHLPHTFHNTFSWLGLGAWARPAQEIATMAAQDRGQGHSLY